MSVACVALPSCDEPAAPAPTPSQVPVQAKRSEVLLFAPALRADDEAVNAFVETAMKTSVGGDYDAFRLLWSETREPLSRSEFEKGWEAVREIEVLALERVRVELSKPARDGEVPSSAGSELIDAYALLAEVRLDPDHSAGRKEPFRDVVLLLVEEEGAWKLSPAPKAVRTWIREKAGKPEVDPSAGQAVDVTQSHGKAGRDAEPESKTEKPSGSDP